MKKIFILLFLFLIINKHYGQSYYPFPSTYGIWTYAEYDDFHNPTGMFSSIYLEGDTIIGTQSYKKLCGEAFCGGLREDNRKIYFYNTDSLNEYLLYDFTAQAGDTILNVWSEWSITNLDTAFIFGNDSAIYSDGLYHKGYYVGCGDHIIEGVGGEMGLLEGCFKMCLTSGSWILSCCINDGSLIYNYGGYCVTDAKEDTATSETFEIFPNPSSQNISIVLANTNKHSYTYKISDITGKILITGNKNESTINIENLSQGIYFITIESSGDNKTTKFIKN